MKFTLARAVILVVVAAVCGSTEVSSSPAKTDLIHVGTTVARNRLLYSGQFIRSAAANTIHIHDHTWRGGANTVITSVRAWEVGTSQGATARITAGGVGWNGVTVRMQSAVGRGFNIVLDIYGL